MMRFLILTIHFILSNLTGIYKHTKKGIRDVALTLYDDMSFKIISLIRVLCFTSFLAILASWVLDQCFNMPYERADILLETFKTAMLGYVAKRVDSCVKNLKKPQPGDDQQV